MQTAVRASVPGAEMYALASRLFPLHRSLTGNGVRATLRELKGFLPNLQIIEVPSGTKAFDWEVPLEWTLRDAYVLNERGERVIDVRRNNLHVVAYSEPVDRILTRGELESHLHSLPEQPDAIPFVMSYYERRWGFCISQAQRVALPEGRYRVVIDSSLAPGHMTYGELVLPGSGDREVLLSTYLCHPSMANDNLSGICVTAYLARWISELTDRRHTYRILFIPETIGSIVYLSRHLEHLQRHTIAGFVITCVGDEGAFSLVPSRKGDTLADRVSLHVLQAEASGLRRYSYLDRGSDERQYCSPGVDLPVVCVTRAKFREYPEYHTSLDDLGLISASGLGGSWRALRRCVEVLEVNRRYRATFLCEPQLGRRALFPTLSIKGSGDARRTLLNVLAYCDGKSDLLGIAERVGAPADHCASVMDELVRQGLVEEVTAS
jgi:aminopeptidase-like protein